MSSDPRHRLGLEGERLAGEHLERLGYEVLARRYRTRFGEIDLIAADDRALVFCEVKTRRAGSGSPWESLHPVKCAQVRRMAAAWLVEAVERPSREDLRFDAIAVVVDPRGALVGLEHIEAAF